MLFVCVQQLYNANTAYISLTLQLAIWHCVITGIMAINTKMMKLWKTTITFFSCACAYILGLPMATEVCLISLELSFRTILFFLFYHFIYLKM